MKLLTKTRRRVKLSHDERMRRLRLGDLRRLIEDRCRGKTLPDDDAGREYLNEILLPISLGPVEASNGRTVKLWTPADRMLREIELRTPWMSADEVDELLTDINLMPPWQRKPKARTLGEQLNVTYAERARLRLQTIGPCDMTEKAMKLIRKQKKRQADKLRRQRQPRSEYLAASLSQTRPWEQMGISRRTWERRRVASVHQVNLTKGQCIPASAGMRVVRQAEECGRLPTPTPAWQAQTWDGEEEAAWVLSWDKLAPYAVTTQAA